MVETWRVLMAEKHCKCLSVHERSSLSRTVVVMRLASTCCTMFSSAAVSSISLFLITSISFSASLSLYQQSEEVLVIQTTLSNMSRLVYPFFYNPVFH